ncbi:MAG: hypothetical protein JW867_03650 [Candidatus Omnitrophica bacterium]|nr:hypothetical protein [Candidatus Omnitrophota bacterium]
MVILMKLLGICYIGLAIVFLLRPKAMDQYIQFWFKDKRMVLGGSAALFFGLIFILASRFCLWKGFYILLGTIAVLKAVMIFVIGEEKMVQISKEVMGISKSAKRILSLFALGIGIMMVMGA